MKILILAGAVLLSGCVGPPPPTQIVEVPVHATCVKEVPTRPAYEFDQLPLDAPDGAKVLALVRDWPRGRKYEGELVAALTGCF